MAEFTQEPWRIGENATGEFLSVWGAEHGRSVTHVFDSRLGSDAPKMAEALANARLIAAAPELYETLKALVSEFGCTIDLYKMLGPHYTYKDGTQVFEISTVLDREPLIEKASALLARIDGATP